MLAHSPPARYSGGTFTSGSRPMIVRLCALFAACAALAAPARAADADPRQAMTREYKQAVTADLTMKLGGKTVPLAVEADIRYAWKHLDDERTLFIRSVLAK